MWQIAIPDPQDVIVLDFKRFQLECIYGPQGPYDYVKVPSIRHDLHRLVTSPSTPQVPGPETSNAVMTAMLIHDLFEPMHNGHPDMPLANPQQIFSQGGFHGGTWRCVGAWPLAAACADRFSAPSSATSRRGSAVGY